MQLFALDDFRTGSIINRLTGERVQVIPTLRWKKLKDDWTFEFQEEASRIIAHVATTLGATIASDMMRNIGDPSTLVNFIADFSAAAGWGVMAMTGEMRHGTRYLVTVTNCVFCDKEVLADSPQCDFLVGAIKGMADLMYDAPHRVSRERCSAMGHALCQFEVDECHNPSLCSNCGNKKYCELSKPLGNL